MQNLTILPLDVPEISLGPKIKVDHVTLAMRLLRVICFLHTGT